MAINRVGRHIYVDTAGANQQIFPAGRMVRIDQARLVAAAVAATALIYAAPDNADDTKRIMTLKAAIESTDDFPTGTLDEQNPPDSMNGLTVTTTGAGAILHIILA